MKVPDTEEELRWSLNRFLANAAKKHNPARIIIILDGINRLKCEGMPDGALHWLPIELPPCVRFLISTVEFERAQKGVVDIVQHRTFVELTRRSCPLLRIEPLNQSVRSQVILAFLGSNQSIMDLTEQQQFKIISAPATSQPMYLRSLLQAMRLSASLTSMTFDQLLEQFLYCSTAHELVDKNLDICTKAVFSEPESHDSSKVTFEILGKMFSIVHVSRTGLTESEIWGVLKMVTGVAVDEPMQRKLMGILKEFTMVVDDMHSFSHEIYREVVYDKYIRTREQLIQWHYFMARYFGQLPTCERKLVALPYHLEFAGAWSKVKNCLTDINMFQLWWTPKFKTDFIKFWASLTRVNPKQPESSGSHGGKTGHHTGKSDTTSKEKDTRPHYDVVEEYVKSLDEFRRDEHPSDEQLASIILLIGDFLLEFAELGHEANADIPNIIHPFIPHEDLECIGVPYIRQDEMGRSELHLPQVFSTILLGLKEGDDGNDQGQVKAVTDIPFCTTFFFHRWMWIQFPYIALGNCNARYLEGVKMKEVAEAGYAPIKRKDNADEGMMDTKKKEGSTVTRTFNTDAFKLPAITFNRKAARSHRRVPADGGEDAAAAAADKVTQRMESLHDDIQNYREECDFIMQMKAGLSKRLAELSGTLETLKRSAESVHQFDDALQETKKRDEEASSKYDSVKLLNKNLKKLVAMCDRHPPNVPALILEIEAKIDQDKFLLAEIKKRLWEQKFEFQMHNMNYKIMKFLSKKGEKMHTKLLEYRIDMKMALTMQATEDERRLGDSTQSVTNKRTKRPKSITNGTLKGESKEEQSSKTGMTWEEMWPIISSRTGITEPDIFFMRLSNGSSLQEQMGQLKKTVEVRLEDLRTDIVDVEAELEDACSQASVGGQTYGKQSQENALTEKNQSLKHIKEKAEAMEQIEKQVIGGLNHLGELLGVPARMDDAPITDLLRDIDAILDTLNDEVEKQQSQNQSVVESSSSRVIATREANPVVSFCPVFSRSFCPQLIISLAFPLTAHPHRAPRSIALPSSILSWLDSNPLSSACPPSCPPSPTTTRRITVELRRRRRKARGIARLSRARASNRFGSRR